MPLGALYTQIEADVLFCNCEHNIIYWELLHLYYTGQLRELTRLVVQSNQLVNLPPAIGYVYIHVYK